MSQISLYEEVLRAGAEKALAPHPTRPSAGVVLWRARGTQLEVFWIQRAPTMPFMGGWRAFPGGTWTPRDVELPVQGCPDHPCPGRPTLATADPAEQPEGEDLLPGIGATALRELWEETGLLIVNRQGVRLSPNTPWSVSLREHGAELDVGRLRFAGRWLTPPFAPVRFDNRFFLLQWKPEDGEPKSLASEYLGGEWIQPAVALDRLHRGEELAAPPIYHILRVLAEDGPEKGVPRLLNTSECNLGPLRRIELRPGILLFPLRTATLPPATHTNTYLVGHGDCLLIDPGSEDPDELTRLESALKAAERELGRRVQAVFLTHHHPDHVAGTPWFQKRWHLPVWAHRATAERLKAQGIPVDRFVGDGEELSLGSAREPFLLRSHWTPGHAPGHLALEVVETGDLLSGDLVSALSTVVIAAPEGDMTAYLDTLEKMSNKNFRTLFPSHGAPLLDPPKVFRAVLEHRQERERRILEAWVQGTREVDALVRATYDELPLFLKPLATRQVEAHLSRLQALGKLETEP